MRRIVPLVLLGVVLGAQLVRAQGQCADLVTRALQAVQTTCTGLERNSACYGFYNLETTFTQPEAAATFDAQGERTDLANLQSIRTRAFDATRQEWGIAVLRLQANIPGTLPGQAVTMVLLGDTRVASAVSPDDPDAAPMQAITLSTGLGQPACENVPPSSVIVQGPRGLTVDLTVNGANFRLSSTAVFRATADRKLSVGMVDGRMVIDENVIVPVGHSVQADLDDEGMIIEDSWSEPEIFDEEELALYETFDDLPDDIFEYAIEAPTEEELALWDALDDDMLASLDLHALEDLLGLLLAEGYTPEDLFGLTADDLDELLLEAFPDLDPELQDLLLADLFSLDDDLSEFDPFEDEALDFEDDFAEEDDTVLDDEAAADDEAIDEAPPEDEGVVEEDYVDDGSAGDDEEGGGE